MFVLEKPQDAFFRLLAGREDGGAWMDRLITAALKDENGDALDGALKTVREL